MISQTAEYALCAVVRLASCGAAPQTVRQIASATSMPASYLPKVLSYLHRAGIVSSQRGLHGGILLLRRPEELSLAEVIEAVEPALEGGARAGCPRRADPELAALYALLAAQAGAMRRALSATTVADVLVAPRVVYGPARPPEERRPRCG